MKNRLLTLCFMLALLCCSHVVSAQNVALDNVKKDPKINVIAFFCKNDTMNFTASNTQYKVEHGDTIVESDMAVDFMIVVKDSTSNGYTFELTETALHIYKVDKIITRVLCESMHEMTKDVKCVFETDKYGVVQGITNWRELSDRFITAQAAICDTLFARNEGLDSVVSRSRLEQMIMQRISSEESLRSQMYEEIDMMFGYHGKSWPICEKEWEDTYNGYPRNCYVRVAHTKKKDETDCDGDYVIASQATMRIPVGDALERGVDYYGSLLSDSANKKMQENKQSLVDAIKKCAKEVAIIDMDIHFFFVNGWPKECCKIRKVVLGDFIQNITVDNIAWKSHYWNDLR